MTGRRCPHRRRTFHHGTKVWSINSSYTWNRRLHCISFLLSYSSKVFQDMARGISATQAILNDPSIAAAQVIPQISTGADVRLITPFVHVTCLQSRSTSPYPLTLPTPRSARNHYKLLSTPAGLKMIQRRKPKQSRKSST